MSLKLQILMALLSCAAVRAQCQAEGLEDGQAKCDSCFGYTSCAGTAATSTVCAAETACYQDGDTNAVCVSVANNDYECATCPAGSFTTCDPFNPDLVVACVAGQAPTLITDCNTNTPSQTCQNGACVTSSTGSGETPDQQCVDAVTEAGTDAVIIPYMPACTSGLLCSGTGAVSSLDCSEGQYFDPRTGKCQSLPVDNCAGYGDASAPSRTDCTKFVACKESVEVAEYDCPAELEYDTNANECGDPAGANFLCGADLAGCTFESDGSGGSSETTSGSDETTTAESGGSETTTSSSTTKPEECTADNVNQRYPVEGDCKSYWVCRKTSANTYAYIKSQCSGTLVYNPDTTYCDLPDNVPGCEE